MTWLAEKERECDLKFREPPHPRPEQVKSGHSAPPHGTAVTLCTPTSSYSPSPFLSLSLSALSARRLHPKKRPLFLASLYVP